MNIKSKILEHESSLTWTRSTHVIGRLIRSPLFMRRKEQNWSQLFHSPIVKCGAPSDVCMGASTNSAVTLVDERERYIDQVRFGR